MSDEQTAQAAPADQTAPVAADVTPPNQGPPPLRQEAALRPLPDRDMADGFMQERAAPTNDNPVLQALRRKLAGPSGATPGDAAPAAKETDAESGGAATDAAPAPAADAATGARHAQLRERLQQLGTLRTGNFADYAIGVARAAAKDVYVGTALEGAPQVFKGMNDALANVFDTGNDLANWLNENVADLPVGGPNPLKELSAAAKDFAEGSPEAKTMTGKAVEFTAQWLTGGKMVGEVGQAIGMPAGKFAQLVKDMATGAVAFDPKVDRLSNTIDADSPNPLTAWLKASPDDSKALGRLKNALEVGGLGVAVDGVIKAFRFMRGAGDAAKEAAASGGSSASALKAVQPGGASKARAVRDAEGRVENDYLNNDVLAQQYLHEAESTGREGIVAGAEKEGFEGAVERQRLSRLAGNAANDVAGNPARDWLPIGDAKLPLVEIAPDMEKKAAAFLSGEADASPAQINMARIAGPDDVKAAVDKIARTLPKTEPENFAQIAAGARELGLTPDDVLQGLQGGALDARQITASRMMMRSAATQLQALANKVASPMATPQDMASFNRAYALTYGLMQQVKGSSAEIGRALSAHRIMAQDEPEALKQIQGLLDQVGGPQATRDMALKISALNDPSKITELVNEAAKGSTHDNLTYAYMNLLVSNPASHMANIAGNAGSAAIDIWERWLAGKIRSSGLSGAPDGGVADGEAMARMYGQARGTWDGFAAGARALKTGVQDFGAAKEIPTAPAVNLGEGATTGATDYLKMLLPTRWLGAEDQVFKWMHYRGELASLSFRQGTADGLTGPALRARVDDALAHPPPGMHQQAVDAALKLTFNSPLGPFAQKLSEAMRNWTFEIRPGVELPVGKIVMPFTQTPANVFKWNFERAPGLGLISRDMRRDIAAGGAARDLALAKQATGAVVAGLAWDLVQQGRVTGGGPNEPELRGNLTRQGWQPYSIRVGDTYYGYDRMDTPGMLFGAIADVADIMTWANDEDRQQIAGAIALAASRAVMSRSYMQGVGGLVNAMSDPARYGDSWAQKLAGSPVPALVSSLNLAADPTLRNATPAQTADPIADTIKEMANAIRARTPGLSKDLPPRTDLWGQDMKVMGAWLPGVHSDMNRLISPVKESPVHSEAIDGEMARLRLKVAAVKEVASFAEPVDGTPGPAVPVRLMPQELYRYSKLQGQEAVDPRSKLNLQDSLNEMVRGEGQMGEIYRRLNDDGKSLVIQQTVQSFRALARVMLIQEFPEIGDAIKAKREDLAASQQPNGQGGGQDQSAPPGMTVGPANARTNRLPQPRIN